MIGVPDSGFQKKTCLPYNRNNQTIFSFSRFWQNNIPSDIPQENPSHPMPAVFEYHHLVKADEIDGQGHVNNVAYVRWMQDAAVAHSTEQGWEATRYREIDSGWVARMHTIEYLQPAFEGDQILVLTWISDMKKITSRRKYKITRPADSTVLAVAETNWAFVSFSKSTPKRIPAEIFKSFDLVEPDHEP